MSKRALVKEYAEKHRYFSLPQILQDVNLEKKLVEDYLFQLKQENVVFEAGYGFFSTVAEKFPFTPVRRVEVNGSLLEKTIRLLIF